MLRQFSRSLFGNSAVRNFRNYATHIAHITDSEGTRSFFDSIKRSSILSYHPDKGLNFKTPVEQSHFIFGGDAFDRGKYDLDIARVLLDLKNRHPDNLTLLAGNREIMKTRYRTELNPGLIRERLLYSQQPFWISKPTLPLDYVVSQMKAEGKYSDNKIETLERYVEDLSISECQLIYLRWMLEQTMGCPNSFRYRREALAQTTQGAVSDDDVLQSFLRETEPDGLKGQYLQKCQLGIIIPEARLLSVHGGLTAANIGRTPDMTATDQPILNAQLWIDKLNNWYQEQLQLWINFKPEEVISGEKHALNKKAEIPPAGNTALNKSVLPSPNKAKFIMTADMLNAKRQFVNIPPEVVHYLNQNDIATVLTGHQPSGDHPAVLRAKDNSVLFINDDTGYSNPIQTNPDDTRGKTIHATEIFANKDITDIQIRATLSDGTETSTDLTITKNTIEGDPYIGKVLSDNRLVQCRLPDGDYRLVEQKAFQVSYSKIDDASLAKILGNKVQLR